MRFLVLITLLTVLTSSISSKTGSASLLVEEIKPLNLTQITNLVNNQSSDLIAIYDRTQLSLGIEIWDSGGKYITSLFLDENALVIYSIEIHNSGAYIAVHTDVSLDVWRLIDSEIAYTFQNIVDYEFFPQQTLFVYSTIEINDTSPETLMLDLTTGETIDIFKYQIQGGVLISADEKEIIISDHINEKVFALKLNETQEWEWQEISDILSSQNIKNLTYSQEGDILILVTYPSMLSGETLSAVDADDYSLIESEFYPGSRIFVYGSTGTVLYPDNSFVLLDVSDSRFRELGFSGLSDDLLIGASSTSDQYAIMRSNTDIEIFDRSRSKPVVNLGKCLCRIEFTLNPSKWILWDSEMVYLYFKLHD